MTESQEYIVKEELNTTKNKSYVSVEHLDSSNEQCVDDVQTNNTSRWCDVSKKHIMYGTVLGVTGVLLMYAFRRWKS
jgi:hypothetical protein